MNGEADTDNYNHMENYDDYDYNTDDRKHSRNPNGIVGIFKRSIDK